MDVSDQVTVKLSSRVIHHRLSSAYIDRVKSTTKKDRTLAVADCPLDGNRLPEHLQKAYDVLKLGDSQEAVEVKAQMIAET